MTRFPALHRLLTGETEPRVTERQRVQAEIAARRTKHQSVRHLQRRLAHLTNRELGA